MTAALESNDATGSATTVAMTQATEGWDYMGDSKIGSKYEFGNDIPDVKKGDTIKIAIAADGTVTFTKN